MNTLEERFWAKVNKNGPLPVHKPELGRCWLWTSPPMTNGYGQIAIGNHTPVLAHRVAYTLANGPIPDGMEVDHICRVKLCVNSDHLRLATKKQNAENRSDVGSGRSGVRGVIWDASRSLWAAKLTHNYKTINLGRFPTIEAAHAAATEARRDIFTHSTERTTAT